MPVTTSTIAITFDKSHLSTIGTRLYAESLDLVRELVANAYDADATRVDISLSQSELSVSDDGSGMDKEGLTQYFTIGSGYKKSNPISPLFKRQRVGEFGIGKFAVLSLCNRFSIFTRKDGYCATVIFDKEQFESSTRWEIPVIEHEGSTGKSGSRVSLTELRFPVGADLLERRLRQQLPLSQKDFSVYINSVRLLAHIIPGRKYRLREQTEFGEIAGDIILSSLLLPAEQVGIAIKVKGMTIRREFFGLENLPNLPARRLSGEIHADFLPLTSARDNFLKDTKEFERFLKTIEKKIRQIGKDLKKSGENRRDVKTDQALSNALDMVRTALKKNPDIMLLHDLPLLSGETAKNKKLDETMGSTTLGREIGKIKKMKPTGEILKEATKEIVNRHHRGLVKTVLKDKNRLIKRLKIGGVTLVCSLSHLGESESESFVEGGIIFINRDHPLFIHTQNDETIASYHLLRLITAELVKLTRPLGITQAFDWQSRLLTDAMVVKK